MENAGAGDGAPKHYPAKMTVFVFIACLVASSGGLIFGYDIGISGKQPPPPLLHILDIRCYVH